MNCVALDNPLHAAFLQCNSNENQRFSNRRYELCTQYSWAVPNTEAISTLVEHSPIVEIGAGTGYWASLVQAFGGVHIPYDQSPTPNPSNKWHRGAPSYTAVLKGSPKTLRFFKDPTLFLCWPPYAEKMAQQCLKYYQGNTLIYVGEDAGGCTGDEEFHEMLYKQWSEPQCVQIPQWFGIYDKLCIYHRKEVPCTTTK